MPKQKTHKGAAKRIKITSTGKLMHRRPAANHFLQKKSSSRKRGFRMEHQVDSSDRNNLKKQLKV